MLVLERKLGQTVVINANGTLIEVTVIRAGFSRVKIGVEADRDVSVLRKELLERAA